MKKPKPFKTASMRGGKLVLDQAVEAGDLISLDIETVDTKSAFSFGIAHEPVDVAWKPISVQAQKAAWDAAQNFFRTYYAYGGMFGGGIGAAVGAILGELSEPKPTEADMRRRKDVRCITVNDSPLVPPGKVAFTRGEGTFNARLRLKAMGGRWQPDLLGGVWLLPDAVIHEAAAAIRLAVKAGRELPLDEAEDGVEHIKCYVCGESYTPWAFAALTGAAVGEWYCGCETRKKLGPAPRTATTRTR